MSNFNSTLTQKRLKELLRYDAETGTFTRIVSTSNNAKAGAIAGTIGMYGYRIISIDGFLWKAHRLAFLYVYGTFPDKHIDHINGVRHDNRIANLRTVTVSGNNQNHRGPRKDNVLKVLGVSKHGNRYVARIAAGGVKYVIGSFETIDLARDAYIEEKRRIHTTCTI